MIERLAVLGVGLIGGSVALALREAVAVGEVVGYGRGRENLERAWARGIVDRIADSPEAAVVGADRILLAMPVGGMRQTFAAIALHLRADAVLTDAGSTKQDVVAAARAGLGAHFARFVPAHPIAGAENSGADAARSDLFRGKQVILTPLAETSAAAIDAASELWRLTGAEVTRMAAAEHDRVFAAVSHLPHLAAFALVEELATRPAAELYFRHAGSGFRDFTRIAASSPEMWRDIALANREALSGELQSYLTRLAAYRDALAAGDGDALMQAFTRASQARSRWSPAGNTVESDE